VYGSPLTVFLHVAPFGICKQFVKLRCPVMRVSRMKAHHRRALDGL
jgi:hypothetical protein